MNHSDSYHYQANMTGFMKGGIFGVDSDMAYLKS